MGKEEICELLSSLFCEYKSIRFIKVRNVKLSIIYWFTMLLVLIYVIVFTVVEDRGYQQTGQVSGSTSIKLKGSASIGDENGPLQDLIPLDAMDLVLSIHTNLSYLVFVIIINNT